MPEFTLTVHGLDSLQENLSRLPEDLEAAITQGLEEAAAQAVNYIEDEISNSYPPASFPGEPPATRTGTLKRSVRIESVEPMRVTIAAGGSGTMAPYASWLEFGTSKMAPRPFIQPMIQVLMPEIGNILLESVNQQTEKTMQ